MNQISQLLPEYENLQFWRCVKIKEFHFFVNVNERLITFHPPFLLDDIEAFLVKNLNFLFYQEYL